MPRMLTPPTPLRWKWDDIYKDLGLNKTVAKDDVSVYVDGVSSKDHPNMKDQAARGHQEG